MQYRIEYAGGKRGTVVDSREGLIKLLKLINGETISDISKLYKSGVEDSVMEKYQQYIGR